MILCLYSSERGEVPKSKLKAGFVSAVCCCWEHVAETFWLFLSGTGFGRTQSGANNTVGRQGELVVSGAH